MNCIFHQDLAMEIRRENEARSKLNQEQSSRFRVPSFFLPSLSSDPLETITSPPGVRASIPFEWEEAPGKPRPFNTTNSCETLCTKPLKLPPRLWEHDKFAAAPSSENFLDDPFVDRSVSCSSWFIRGHNGRRQYGSWGGTFSTNREVNGELLMFLSSGVGNVDELNRKVKITKTTRNYSFTNLSQMKSLFLAGVYGSLRQVVPRRRRRK